MDSSNLISEEQKFICWAFILKANNFQNTYMGAFFVSFGTKILSCGDKFIQDKIGNPNSLWMNKPFFPKLYKLYNLYILMDFYLALLKKICPRSSWSDTLSVERPQTYSTHGEFSLPRSRFFSSQHRWLDLAVKFQCMYG